MANAETEVLRLWIRRSNIGGHDYYVSLWDKQSVPDEVVHFVLDHAVQSIGGRINWMERVAPISSYAEFTFGPPAPDIPF